MVLQNALQGAIVRRGASLQSKMPMRLLIISGASCVKHSVKRNSSFHSVHSTVRPTLKMVALLLLLMTMAGSQFKPKS